MSNICQVPVTVRERDRESVLSPFLQIQYTEQIYINVVFQSQWCIKLQMHVAIVYSDKQEDTGHVRRTGTYLPSEPRHTQSCWARLLVLHIKVTHAGAPNVRHNVVLNNLAPVL